MAVSIDIIAEIAIRLPRWHLDAPCRDSDPAIFFTGRGEPTVEARALCAVCPVREPCLDEAIDGYLDHGFRGGLPARDRVKLARERGRPPEPTRDRTAASR